MLLLGDRALVIGYGTVTPRPGGSRIVLRRPGATDLALEGSRLVLVDLSGDPEVIGTLDLDGELRRRAPGRLDRAAGRPLRTSAELDLPGCDVPAVPLAEGEAQLSEDEALAANRELVENSTIEDWLPRFVATDADGASTDGLLVDCEDVSHPREYSGTSMLTVVTLDLAGEAEPQGSVTVVEDGRTVYGIGESLYIADDHSGFPMPFGTMAARPFPIAEPATEIHQLDVSDPGAPQYVASGQVDGWLLNQYSLSEHDGHLRVATTTISGGCRAPDDGPVPRSESGVSVLAERETGWSRSAAWAD